MEIPSGVTSIGEGAFAACFKLVHIRNLSEVTVAVTDIVNDEMGLGINIDEAIYEILTDKESSFKYTLATDKSGVQTYTAGEEVYFMDYTGTETELDLSEYSDITSVYTAALYDNRSLVKIILPDGLKSICDLAFGNCMELTGIEIPESVTSIGNGVFSGCSKLVQVRNLSGVEILYMPQNPDMEILTTTKEFKSVIATDEKGVQTYTAGNKLYLFGYTGTETVLDLSESVIIGVYQYALYNNEQITEIKLPKSVKSVGESAFYGCEGLIKIHFGGTVKEWAAVDKGESWDRATGEYIVECSNGTVDKNGTETIKPCETHDFTVKATDRNNEANAATCTEAAKYFLICSVCGAQSTETFDYGEPTGHSFTEKSTDIKHLKSAADCRTQAVYYVSCSVCEENGENTFFDGEINPDNHNWGNWQTQKEATCTEAGSQKRVCSGCQKDDTQTIAALGHSYKNGVCERCNKSEFEPVVGLKYSANSDGSYTVTGIGTFVDEVLVIPSSYDGHDVTSIGRLAFNGCTQLTSIIIPDSVTSIGGSAFSSCFSLTSIVIPDSVTSIGDYAFSYCDKLVQVRNLSSVDISQKISQKPGLEILTDSESEFTNILTTDDNGVQTYTAGDKVYLFGYKGTETVLDLSDYTNITDIYQSVFIKNSNITEIKLPDGVTSIGRDAFNECRNLMSIIIPDGVTSIGSFSAFFGCDKLVHVRNLSSIDISQYISQKPDMEILTDTTSEFTNILTTDDNGVQTYTAGDKVYLFGYTGTETVLDLSAYNITDIYQCALRYNEDITSITLPEVKSIGEYAFVYCSSLASIVIPDSVTSVGVGAVTGTAWYDNKPDEAIVYIGKVCYEYKRPSVGTPVNITSITIAPGTVAITNQAFSSAKKLESITIPRTVTSIGKEAFRWCGNLKEIEFKGTVEDWKKIEKGEYWDYDTGDYSVTCTNGTVAKDGTVTYS